jgi:hypothetical protein
MEKSVNMEKEFVSYELAIKLEELGFDEPCCGFYDHMIKEIDTISADACERLCKHHTHIKAPTWQSAFRWFREEYNLFGKIYIVNFGADEYSFDIYDLYEEKTKYDNFIGAGTSYSGTFDTYEEAELVCLTKLIEIVEQKEK